MKSSSQTAVERRCNFSTRELSRPSFPRLGESLSLCSVAEICAYRFAFKCFMILGVSVTPGKSRSRCVTFWCLSKSFFFPFFFLLETSYSL